MLKQLTKLLYGDPLKKHRSIPEKVNSFEEVFKSLSDADLKEKTLYFKSQLAQGKTLEDILPEAFAAVREASRRTLGQFHYEVQLIGGSILHHRGIAEMRTGEGKTLVATLPAYLNALTGDGVHVVTVNDYLSRRDAAWMGQVYDFLGMSISVINSDNSYIYDASHTNKKEDELRDTEGSFKVVHEFLRPISRTDAYKADIVYGTNSEFGFDYLRDNIELSPSRLRQRGHAFAIVDEVDSILIDEARTPLIISGPTKDAENLYDVATNVVKSFVQDVDYTMDEKHRSIAITDAGIEKAEKALKVENIYTDKGIRYVHHLETAIKAKALYKKDKDYVVKDGEVIIVDTFTGRLQPGRRWSEGLHQAIESKEGMKIQKESRTYASITYQNYFRMYKKLAGMTGTAMTSTEEFYKVYGLNVVEVPTHRSIARKDNNDFIFQNENGKYVALARIVKELQQKGQPVLIGTASIEKNEQLSEYLSRAGVRHEVLNAKNHEREAMITADAGKKGAVTVATNMAGRGIDIKLGGAGSTKEAYDEVKSLGGLFVIGTERHEARRIDNQLRGRAGRQGDPGETQFFVSLDDDLMRIFASGMIKASMSKIGVREDEPIQNSLINRVLESAQKKIEGMHFDSRKHVLDYDNVLNFQRGVIYGRRSKILLGNREQIQKELTAIESVATPEELTALHKKRDALGEDHFWEVLRQVLLRSIDLFWIDHLEMMDYLRSSVHLRAYGQRDPLVEYKKEGLRLFKDLEASVYEEVLRIIPLAEVTITKQEAETVMADASVPDQNNILTEEEINRNDPCPCGSGKKWKKCGYLNTEEHQKCSCPQRSSNRLL
ncbi:MAG: preprotein translocase subunit SecA [Candidatus Parcubacteria bacterium]|jgi:preprotein translocase subunit SecA